MVPRYLIARQRACRLAERLLSRWVAVQALVDWYGFATHLRTLRTLYTSVLYCVRVCMHVCLTVHVHVRVGVVCYLGRMGKVPSRVSPSQEHP